jgi:sugar phosphate isomerase/epimerase
MLPLAYSSNVHPAETVDELIYALDNCTGEIRKRLGWDMLGLDFRIGAHAITQLHSNDKMMKQLRKSLDKNKILPYTINGFPLKPFQTDVVKADAYRPDWTEAERQSATANLLDIALELSDEELITISTVPGSYRPFGAKHNDPKIIAAAFGAWAAHAARIQRDQNRTVVLCPEPEPWCFLETSSDVAWFWQGPLQEFGLPACRKALDGDDEAARAAMRRHLGICFDTCHVSLAFEDQPTAVKRMRESGASPMKCQFSAAPELIRPHANTEALSALRAMAEKRFLHQTAAASPTGSLSKVDDLDQLDECLARLPSADTVRSHFHIPVFRERQDQGLSTTVNDSLAGLRACLAAGATHIAVETYTWSILADDERDIIDGTVRELEFLKGVMDGIA